MKYAHIIGWGCYLPERVLTNDDLARVVDTSHEWIYTRTGIRQRRMAGPRETTASLAFEAAVRALTVAGVPAHQIDLIVVATSTPEAMFPSTACRVQDRLGARKAGAFDLSAACSGFVYALNMASQAIATGSIQHALVIGAETMSRVLDWRDRGTCILFGDGAGAVVLQGSDVPGGLLASELRSDGSGGDLLTLPAANNNPLPFAGMKYYHHHNQKHNTLTMNGRQVFRFATQVVASSIQDVLEQANLTMAEVDLIIPHQANTRIIDTAAKKLKIPTDKFFTNLDRLGNTSAASIPIALCEAAEAGLLKPDHNIVFVGFGGGLTWATAVIKWNVTRPEITPINRNWRRLVFNLSRIGSWARRLGRKLGAIFSGSPTPEARLKDADQWKVHRDE
jgi:3-oxoacyl-[acyl-carrier-protein] synthase III